MAKWKCEICNSEFDNFQAQGFNHKIYCPLCYFKKLNNDKDKEIERLNNIIDKIKKLRNANTHLENIYYAEGVLLNEPYCDIEDVDNEELLEILRGEE